MAKTAARHPRPFAFVFTLGKHAKVGKKSVPSAYAAAPCYVYRDADKARTTHLDAIEEEEVDEGQVEALFGAIEDMLDRCDLHRELSTDVEIDRGKSAAYTAGFHPNASFEAACAALEKGGFSISRVIDPLAIPAVKLSEVEARDRGLDDLARHVEYASLADVLACTVKEGELGFHAAAAEDLVERAFASGAADPFARGLHARLPGLGADAKDVLLLLVARVTREAKGKAAEGGRGLLATLPAPSRAEVKKLLATFPFEVGTKPAPATAKKG